MVKGQIVRSGEADVFFTLDKLNLGEIAFDHLAATIERTVIHYDHFK